MKLLIFFLLQTFVFSQEPKIDKKDESEKLNSKKISRPEVHPGMKTSGTRAQNRFEQEVLPSSVKSVYKKDHVQLEVDSD